MNQTGYFSHADCRRHEMGPGHPECPERLDAISDRLLASGVSDALVHGDAPLATLDHIARAHDPAYVSRLQQLSERLHQEAASGGVSYASVDPDTVLNVHTWQAALRAAGAAVAATDAVLAGTVENAFCAVRPPGHHACRTEAIGFCFFNNVAIAVRHALEHHHLQRVAVVDFDVHHGNGTEDILAGDPRVLMVGFFQHPFYPGTGSVPLAANMHNLPLPAYTRGPAVRALIDAEWVPRLEAFRPEMLFISAGFDAHRDDSLGQLGLTEADFAWITSRLKDIAQRFSKGRIVSCLEGGYDLRALASSVEAHVRALADL